MNVWMRFILVAIATWRLTHLIAREDGPGRIMFALRRRFGQSFLGGLMDCFQCLSLWIAAPLALWLAEDLATWLFAWLASSGAACLLQRLGNEPVVVEPLTSGQSERENPWDAAVKTERR
jgi:hypothetical protein